jgi:hypothetical protein
LTAEAIAAPELEPAEPALDQTDAFEASERARPARATRAGKSRDTPQGAAEAAAHDSALVYRAVQALRREKNPKLAAKLLDQDRMRNPHGPLAEEALSLRIEAALELGDPRAKTFAAQYLARYPRGRYLAIARRANGDGSR